MFGNKYILSAVLACIPLATQAAETVYTFDSVVAIEHADDTGVLITGILVNDTVPTTVTLPWSTGWRYDRCEKLFNVVLSQPAAYSLTVATELVTGPGGPPGSPPVQYVSFVRCRAEVKP